MVIRDGYTPKIVATVEKKRCRHRQGPVITPDEYAFEIQKNTYYS